MSVHMRLTSTSRLQFSQVYSHDKQPLLELSLRVSLPVVELLNMLGQLARLRVRRRSSHNAPQPKAPLVVQCAKTRSLPM